MNRTALKNYAPQARREFIQAMTDRAAFYGLTAAKIEPVTEQGDVALIGGKAFPKAVAPKRKRLEVRVKRDGFAQTMEAMAYTWFNRLVAIRYMELHGYLEHGYRVLSNSDPAKSSPEILEQAQHVELPGLKPAAVIEMKLDGNRESELYRMILVAQCNALHSAMPFLFEKIDDETELLLPDNLLHSDSLMRKLVGEIEEEDWNEVEIIGWLYQFYISEKKDEVIGKVVASEDIPAATQLFTPNWIVKYLVQNTLGRQWLATYPQSALRQQMEFYIEPAEQTPEVQEQLKAITPSSLNPEELTLLDPACGSGHILVEAYDLFKAIYQERGYRAKDIPALILQKNLFGLEIDDRAAQLAAFALIMKARADDRRLFENHVQPHVIAFVETKEMDAAEIGASVSGQWGAGRPAQPDPPPGHLFEKDDNLFTRAVSRKPPAAVVSEGTKSYTPDDGQPTADIRELIDLFAEVRTFGSLIKIPLELSARLPLLEQRVNEAASKGELSRLLAMKFQPVVEQAWLLARQYDCVVANPPYMGGRYMNKALRDFGRQHYPDTKADLFSICVERFLAFTIARGLAGFMTPFTWMFIKTYERLRIILTNEGTIYSLVRPEYHAFFESAYVPICAFTCGRSAQLDFKGTFVDLSQFYGEALQPVKLLEAINDETCNWRYTSSGRALSIIPGTPIAYWIKARMRQCFLDGTPLGEIANTCSGMTTADNNRFLRRWHEVCNSRIGFGYSSPELAKLSLRRWFPYNKGGAYRRWYGNNEFLVNWECDGREIIDSGEAFPRSKHLYFRAALTWTDISSASFAVRCSEEGFLFDASGPSAFIKDGWQSCIAGFLCCKIVASMLAILNPTMHFQPGNVASMPVLLPQIQVRKSAIDAVVLEAVQLARADWDSFEISWDFKTLPVLQNRGATAPRSAGFTLAQSQAVADAECLDRIQRMKQLEEENNRLFIDAYGLQDELSPEVTDDQITLYRPDRIEDIKRLISYAIGCIMGRYSLDNPGLNYAHSGNQGFDAGQYKTFRADDDGIIPMLEADWGILDDATNRVVEFVGVAWSKEHLEENLKFVADSLGPTGSEQPRETIRRYLSTGFYKHHLSMYKKRPIYWLFSSGKQRAFQCLVYLHRYHEGTLARMRTEYVIPLQGRYAANIEQLATDISSATSTSQRKKLEKERDKLIKQQSELQTFDEKLKHAADKRISLDLDDGVKVNYGKFSDPQFGDILAEVKAITGGKDED